MDTMVTTDVSHVGTVVEQYGNDTRYIVVEDTECVIDGLTREEMVDRNLHNFVGDRICRIEAHAHGIWTLKFHESLCGGAWSVGPTSTVSDVSSNVGDVVDQIDTTCGVTGSEFASVEAASQGSNGLTDYEFEFELMV